MSGQQQSSSIISSSTAKEENKIILDKPYQNNPQSIVEYFYYNGWNKRNVAAIKDVMAENVKFRGGLTTPRMKKFMGRSGFLDYMAAAHAALAGNNCEIEELIVNPDNKKAAVRITVRGIHKGTFFGIDSTEGTEISYDGTAFFTFNDDCTQIIALWALADINSLKNQIGATTDSTFL